MYRKGILFTLTEDLQVVYVSFNSMSNESQLSSEGNCSFILNVLI